MMHIHRTSFVPFGGVSKYDGLTRQSGERTIWNDVVRKDRDALTIPRRWRKARKIFTNSISDLFLEQVFARGCASVHFFL